LKNIEEYQGSPQLSYWYSALRNIGGRWVSCFNRSAKAHGRSPTYVHLIFNSTHLLRVKSLARKGFRDFLVKKSARNKRYRNSKPLHFRSLISKGSASRRARSFCDSDFPSRRPTTSYWLL